MNPRNITFSEAEALVGQWRGDETIEQVEPGVEFCDCKGQGIFDIIDVVSGSYEEGRYIGSISGVLMKCDLCGKQVFSTLQSHFWRE